VIKHVYQQSDVDKMKLFGRNQNKDKDVEKPIITYYAKYIGVLSSNKSIRTEERAYVNIYEDRIGVELQKRKFRTIIPYKSMTDIRSVDTGKKVDPGTYAIITLIKYSDDDSKPQTTALDFIHNTKYAQPLIDKKFREVQNPPSHADTKATMSIADELSKLAKLKEQGVITEEEFSQMKRNLMEGMKDH
jgi:Short C-terminal domain